MHAIQPDLSYRRRLRIRIAMFWVFPIAYFAAAGSASVGQWRWAVFSVAIGAILLTIGFLAVGIFLFRKKTTDRTLLYFGVFSILYAVRMFMREQLLFSAFGFSSAVAGHIDRTITVTIALPIQFLFMEIVQPRWRRIILWTLGVQTVFACLGILSDFLGVARRQVDITNSLLLLASWILLSIFLFFLRPPGRLPHELRIVATGFAVLSLFVLHANLVGLAVIPGRNVEPIGFLFFVCTLGYLVAQRIFAREESLFAIQKELEIAEQIQASILPRDVPRLAGLEIAARYLPMSSVAGDFYDFLVIERGRLGVLVADVTGHGVPAALIASMLKVAFASQSAHADDPARVLTGLNQALCGKFEEHFVTAAYLYVELEAKMIRYAGAGHPPLLYSNRAHGDGRSIEKNGFFLGMFPEAEYSSVEMQLQPGDRYVLYTDGLPESKSVSGEEFGIARCSQFLASRTQLPAAALADELLREITSWSARPSGSVQEDDMTLVVLDFTGSA
jgi:sigma-B regulation protein RsbU (phosphoserine phosphatase)